MYCFNCASWLIEPDVGASGGSLIDLPNLVVGEGVFVELAPEDLAGHLVEGLVDLLQHVAGSSPVFARNVEGLLRHLLLDGGGGDAVFLLLSQYLLVLFEAADRLHQALLRVLQKACLVEILQLILHGLRIVHLLLHLLHAPLKFFDPGKFLDNL